MPRDGLTISALTDDSDPEIQLEALRDQTGVSKDPWKEWKQKDTAVTSKWTDDEWKDWVNSNSASSDSWKAPQ